MGPGSPSQSAAGTCSKSSRASRRPVTRHHRRRRKTRHPVLRHRIVPTFAAEADGITVDDLISRLIKEQAAAPPRSCKKIRNLLGEDQKPAVFLAESHQIFPMRQLTYTSETANRRNGKPDPPGTTIANSERDECGMQPPDLFPVSDEFAIDRLWRGHPCCPNSKLHATAQHGQDLATEATTRVADQARPSRPKRLPTRVFRQLRPCKYG